MAGRAWSFGPIEQRVTLSGPRDLSRWTLVDYMGGIMDTLDGSSGRTFTYLPIVFEDDCQVVGSHFNWVDAPETNTKS